MTKRCLRSPRQHWCGLQYEKVSQRRVRFVGAVVPLAIEEFAAPVPMGLPVGVAENRQPGQPHISPPVAVRPTPWRRSRLSPFRCLNPTRGGCRNEFTR